MAEEKKTEETEAGAETKKSNSLMLIVIIIVLVVVILIGAIIAVLMMGGDSSSSKQVQKNVQQSASSQPMKRSHAELDNSRTLNKIGILYPLDTFTVNLLSENGSRYLKAQISLELSGQELAAELDSKKAVIRDRILRLLSSKSLEEVSTLKGKDKLSEQMMDVLNPMLTDGSINGIYFTEFVIQ
ncbi:flagellar basal body-associated protein FliL [Sulfurimonas sp. HSL-1716]|uniref:flagellar basal body-associated protein FliL n=1 Tax=Hydrocurvibacter sulfurireducens TaxID=3131937 RepID=UPI0031F8CFCF